MNISEVIAALQKVVQAAGDIPVAVKAVESGAETVLTALSIHIPTVAGGEAVVHLEHAPAGSATPAPAEGDPQAPPAA